MFHQLLATTGAILLTLLMPTVGHRVDAREPSSATADSVVATVHPLATQAGLLAMREGGNAVDAAVAAALTLGVVDGFNSGIGGGCFILIRKADGTLVAIDGREMAPAKATRDMFLRDGQPQPELSQTGALASGVPGALAAYDKAVRDHGNRSLADLLLPAARLAEQGFRVSEDYAENLVDTAEDLRRFEGSRAVLLQPDGGPWQSGDTLRQPDLAATYRGVAQQGVGWFYDGPFAEATAAWMAENGGIMTAEDFGRYHVVVRQPVVTTYRDFTVIGFPPPSSGGVHVAQILNILESFDLAALYRNDPAVFVHVVAEAMKLAFADRAYWLGDADFVDVPRGLADKTYGRQLAARIDPTKVTEVAGHGTPPGAEEDFFGKHTTHIAAADVHGNWVAITATVNTTFGSKVIIPGTGVVMNNQMDDFSIHPGTPNAFGLIGAEANAVQAGKRPLSSMSPTIILRDGQPVMTVGAAGGPKIITQAVLAIVRHLDLGMPLDDALAAPRFHHQWRPNRLLLESSTPSEIVARLQALGHEVQRSRSVGVSQAITAVQEPGQLFGVHDPRVAGQAAGLGHGQ